MLEGNIQGLQHLGLPVTDIEESKIFYGQLGFQEVMKTSLPVQDDAVAVAMLELNGFILELYQPVGKELDEITKRSDGHIDHLALNVLDIDRAFEEIQEAGLEPLEDSPVFLPFWENGVKYFSVRGPDGEKIEFNQRCSK